MSYILDALKKSETERQRQDAPGFSSVPAQAPRRATPAWIWLLGVLMLINAVILAAVLLRSGPDTNDAMATVAPGAPATVPAVAATLPDQPAVPVPQTAAAVSSSSNAAAAPYRRAPVIRETPVAAAVNAAPATPPSGDSTATDISALPTLLGLRADGLLQVPDLHLDVHVYSGRPQDRFVFVNMSKYREQTRLSEGPLVKEIIAEGVILEYDGHTFLLPRQ